MQRHLRGLIYPGAKNVLLRVILVIKLPTQHPEDSTFEKLERGQETG